MQAPEGTAAKNRAVALDYAGDRLIAGMFYDDVQTAGSAVGQAAVPVTRSKTLAAGANYRFDAVRLSAYLQQNRIAGLSSTRGSLLGAAVPIGLGEVRASWVHTNNTGASASLFAVGYTYFLSKRSQLYTTVAQMSNRDRARFALWPSSQDIGAAGAPLPGHDMRGVQVGFRHYF